MRCLVQNGVYGLPRATIFGHSFRNFDQMCIQLAKKKLCFDLRISEGVIICTENFCKQGVRGRENPISPIDIKAK